MATRCNKCGGESSKIKKSDNFDYKGFRFYFGKVSSVRGAKTRICKNCLQKSIQEKFDLARLASSGSFIRRDKSGRVTVDWKFVMQRYHDQKMLIDLLNSLRILSRNPEHYFDKEGNNLDFIGPQIRNGKNCFFTAKEHRDDFVHQLGEVMLKTFSLTEQNYSYYNSQFDY